MRFLVDAQLPPALARWLTAAGHEAEHVLDRGLDASDDRDIWSHALTTGAVIVSKDEDFAIRRLVEGQGPCIIWVRVGNTSRRAILHSFESLMPGILAALTRGDTLIEIT